MNDRPQAGTSVTDSAAEPGPGRHVPAWQVPIRFVLSVLGKVFRDPVVYGRLRAIAWPRGLALVVFLSGGLYLIAVALAVSGPWLRTWLPLEAVVDGQGSAPSGLIWVVMGLVYFALALFQTGTLHAAWWVRILGLVVSFVGLTRAGSTGDHRTAATQMWVLMACFVVLVLLQVVRWRKAFVWWEFPIVLITFGMALISAAGALNYSSALLSGAGTNFASITLAQLGFLVGPVAMASGFAIAQVAFATVVWTVDLGRREWPNWIILVVLVGLLGWRLVAEVARVLLRENLQIAQVIWSFGLVGAAFVLWLILDRLADRRGPGSTRIADLSEDLRHVITPVAVAILAIDLLLPLVVWPLRYLSNVAARADSGAAVPLDSTAEVVNTYLGSDHIVFEVTITICLLLVAGRLAWRGDRGKAELVGTVSLVYVAAMFSSVRFSTDYLGLWVVLILAVVTVVLAARRRLSATRAQALLIATGLAALLRNREFLSDPLNVLLGGSAALLLSLLWALLTSGDDGNGDTRAFPRPARVCLLLSSALFGMAVLAFKNMSSLLGNATQTLESMNAFGDGLFGNALLLGALVALVLNVVRNEDIGHSEELAGVQVFTDREET